VGNGYNTTLGACLNSRCSILASLINVGYEQVIFALELSIRRCSAPNVQDFGQRPCPRFIVELVGRPLDPKEITGKLCGAGFGSRRLTADDVALLLHAMRVGCIRRGGLRGVAGSGTIL